MTLAQFLNRCWHLSFYPLVALPKWMDMWGEAAEPVKVRSIDGKGDKIEFGWQRAALNPRGAMPVRVHDRMIGGEKEYIGDLHPLDPTEYGDDLDTLAARYPCAMFER
jgi:hypothetical protein